MFARGAIGAECMGWLRMIADHAAAAIAAARAFAEIEALRKRLELENEYLREEVSRARAFGELIGQSPALEAVARQIDRVAPTDSAVLILGESGTGKEFVAREIHRRSQRAGEPLIKVNCAAVPRELYESEFFGHARGAFTGALRCRGEPRFTFVTENIGLSLALEMFPQVHDFAGDEVLELVESGLYQKSRRQQSGA